MPDDAARRLAKLYGDLDHAHAFFEGNSRTLREFMRELAREAGFVLDWTRMSIETRARNALYLARDLEVLKRAFPDLTHTRAMQTDDRFEYQASFVLDGLKRLVADKTLAAIISGCMTRSLPEQ